MQHVPLHGWGKADLPQFAWRCPCHGLILLVDLWAGIGGLPLALLALGVRCIVLSAESDPELRQAKRSIFPNIVEIEDVAMVTGKMLHKVISRRSFAAIVIGGGSPCQGNSSLNIHRRGLEDPRSQQPRHLQFLQELQQR